MKEKLKEEPLADWEIKEIEKRLRGEPDWVIGQAIAQKIRHNFGVALSRECEIEARKFRKESGE